MRDDGRVLDLHCDLLIYLAKDPRRRPWDPLARASLPKMLAGGVGTQVLAAFSWLYPEAIELAARQLEIFEALARTPGAACHRLRRDTGLTMPDGRVGVVAALESGATFARADEPLSRALDRLESILERFGPILYISLTWNEENRFGGGNDSKAGLKPDGRALLEFLSGRGVAIDLSHTSDALADGIFEHIDRSDLALETIASHSGFRAVCDVPRNLPDRIAREIIARRGLIGLNFLARFVGPRPRALLDHVEHGLGLGGESALALGADYFSTIDLPGDLEGPRFFPELADSASYPWLFERLGETTPADTLDRIRSGNARAFVERLWRTGH